MPNTATPAAEPQPGLPPPQAPRPRRPRWQLAAWGLACVILAEACLAGLWLLRNQANCGPGPSGAVTHVLFIGNSYTYVNDLPSVFTRLACAGGRKVQTATLATGGWTLANHLASPQTSSTLQQQKWDFVVLQEQSQTPATDYGRTEVMYPAARALVSQIRAQGAQPLFFLTWGHQNGWPEAGLPDYATMQAQLSVGYLGIARELNAPVVPVGAAWQAAQGQKPPLALWQSDGSHPSEAGTYLAACVFYAAVFRQSPEGLAYLGGQPPAAARTLQALAANAVLTEPARWGLP